jgi:hypothetical protein
VLKMLLFRALKYKYKCAVKVMTIPLRFIIVFRKFSLKIPEDPAFSTGGGPFFNSKSWGAIA